jgi:hypothetical protein
MSVMPVGRTSTDKVKYPGELPHAEETGFAVTPWETLGVDPQRDLRSGDPSLRAQVSALM